jgi:hypothetical protein
MRRARSLFVITWSGALFTLSTLSTPADPSVEVTTKDGAPYIPLSSVNASCPQIGPTATTRQDILDAAAVEWAAFDFPRLSFARENTFAIIPPALSPKIAETSGHGTSPRLISIGAMEDDASVRARIGAYWAAVPGAYAEVIATQNQLWSASNGRAGWAEYWSAAFVSYVMCKAGLSNAQFLRAESHRDYIQAAITARESADKTYLYHAYDVGEALPSPGDIICAAREEAANTINSIADFKTNPHGAYHCDIVVGYDTDVAKKPPGYVYAIGGNVLNAVTMTETPVGSGMRLKPLKAPHARNWFAILRYTGGGSSASFRKVPASVLDDAKKLRAARSIDR